MSRLRMRCRRHRRRVDGQCRGSRIRRARTLGAPLRTPRHGTRLGVLGRCFAVAVDVEKALARYEATQKFRANAVQITTRQAEELMSFADEDALPFRNTGGATDYDPNSVPIATMEEAVVQSTIKEGQC